MKQENETQISGVMQK